MSSKKSNLQTSWRPFFGDQFNVAIAGVSRATAYRELTDLVDAGLLLRTGQGRGTRYEIAAP